MGYKKEYKKGYKKRDNTAHKRAGKTMRGEYCRSLQSMIARFGCVSAASAV